MHEIDHAFPPLRSSFAGVGGRTILQGWLAAKPGYHYADVRTRVGEQVFPGVHGLPREDLAAVFQVAAALPARGVLRDHDPAGGPGIACCSTASRSPGNGRNSARSGGT
ncbi:MAG: hypothetical protein WDM96_02820 [Lacunisphaera sp.]